MSRYKVFAPSSELGDEVTIEQSYPAFQVVTASDEAIEGLRKSYPVQEIHEPAAPAVAPTLASLAAANDDRHGRRDIAVTFKYPVREEWINLLRELGSKVIGRSGKSSLILAVPNKSVLAKIRGIDELASVAAHRPSLDLEPSFFEELIERAAADPNLASVIETRDSEADAVRPSRRNVGVPGALILDFFTKADADRAIRRLKRHKLHYVQKIGGTRVLADLTRSKNVEEDSLMIFQSVGLRRVEQKKIKHIFNNVARQVIGRGVVTERPHNNRLSGAGEIVAVADSGLDTGDPMTVHPDFRGRVIQIQSWPIAPSFSAFVTNPGGDDGASDDFSGHGTHVSGSVLGNGAKSVSLGLDPIQGVAPEAQLVFQAIEQRPDWTTQARLDFLLNGNTPPKSGLFGIPDDLTVLLKSAFDSGARIHNNSWGGGVPGAYDTQCQDLDAFVKDHPDFLVVVAVGNSGRDSKTPSGHIDPTSVDSPGTAKNCLTVGASENDRAGQFAASYGDFWPDSFPNGAINSDPMVDDVDDVVAFSSRGPTLTGRRKPDVSAPGTFVLSTRSTQMPANNFAWGAFTPAKDDYMFMGGTSMAAPLVAGSAALLRQFLRTKLGHASPSAALMKAGLIHSAQYMDYRFRAPESAPFADNEQGWGRVNLSSVVDLDSPSRVFFHDESNGVRTGDAISFSVELESKGMFRATLAYSDLPGEQLVNNLNLLVIDPSGHARIGNDFSGVGVFDDLNNVEAVIDAEGEAGIWTVSIVGSDVPFGPQEFGLVVSASSSFEVMAL